MFNIKFWATKLPNGELQYDDNVARKGWINQHFKPGERIEITYKKESQEISKEMYEFLYGAIYTPLGLQEGMTNKELDDLFKEAYVQTNGIYLPKGVEISKSEDFNKAEMLKFIDFVLDSAAVWYGFNVTPLNKEWRK